VTVKSILKPQDSVISGLATAGFVIGIHAAIMPTGAIVQATDAYDHNLESSRRKAAWIEIAAVAAITLLTKDANIFLLGGGTVIALDWHDRHAMSVHPATGQVVTYTQGSPPLSAVS
jgi:hypothetical protein